VEFNLADLFECVADRVPDRVALVAGDLRLTYRQLDDRSTRLAHGLAALGVTAGEHVGVYLYNSAEFLETMLACYKLRAAPVNVNYRYVSDELAYLLDDADLVAIVHHRELCGRLTAIEPRPAVLRLVIDVDDGSPDSCGLDYEKVVSSGSARRDFGPRSGDDHYVLYTGGTTGQPKGVLWRQEDIFFATLGGGNPGGRPIERPEDIGRTVMVNRAQRVAPFLPAGHPGPDAFVCLSLGPLMHASGQWSGLGTLLGGGTLVLYRDRQMDMGKVLDLIAAERVVMLTLVGDASGRPLLDALNRHPGRWDTSSLLLLGSGGSILSGQVKDQLLTALPSVLAITEAIGSSESPVQGVAVARPGGAPSRSLSFAGRDVTMVVDEDLRPVPPGSGRVGRLATRGRVPIGYYKDQERSDRTFVDIDGARWSLPGDMATVDADGTVHLLGRGSLCINTGGEKVYPEEVEAVLKAHPGVADAVVVGRRDPRWGEEVVAVVEPVEAGDPPTLEELRAYCKGRLAGYKAPRSMRLVDRVRRSPAGKPDYPWALGVVRD
jgi:acyl-CoA synthetase (AMP-forming)/AMP-acid ligase II